MAMAHPDIEHICAVSLTSFGYVNAANLTAKISRFYKFCTELLSPQEQYDFGMLNDHSQQYGV